MDGSFDFSFPSANEFPTLPKGRAKVVRSITMAVTMTPADKEKIKQAAHYLQMNQAAFVRFAIMKLFADPVIQEAIATNMTKLSPKK